MSPSPHRWRPWLLAVGALLLWLGGMWLAIQGGLLPARVEGLTTAQVLGQVLGKLAGAFYLLTESLPVLAMMWIGAAGLGMPVRRLLVRQARYRAVIQLGAGLALLLLIDWALAWAGALKPYPAWLLCAAGGAFIVAQATDMQRSGRLNPDDWPAPPWTLLLGLPVLGLLLVACACPPGTLWSVEAFGYDALSYHLQLPREWLEMGRMEGLRHNVYSYLPNLVEAGYMQIGAMRGSMHAGIHTSQFFHASVALLGATALACTVSRFVGRAAGVLGAMTFLALPWTIITASLPYDEMAALTFAAVAILVLSDPMSTRWRGVAVVGFLLGATCLAKLTVGAMVAPAMVLIVLLRLNHGAPWSAPLAWRRAAALSGVIVLAAGLTVGPYLIRNAVWTGNPVFPFAAGTLGRGHWEPSLVQRWRQAHAPDRPLAARLALLGPRWLFSAGYGAVGGLPGAARAEAHDITRFEHDGGVPLLFLAAVASAAVLLAWPAGRRLTAALLVLVAAPLMVWLFTTHLQSRFLLPTLLPLCLLIGLGAGRFEQLTRQRRPWLAPITSVALVALLSAGSFAAFYAQTLRGTMGGEEVAAEPWQIVDSLEHAGGAAGGKGARVVVPYVLNYVLNKPELRDARIYIVADAAVFYVQTPRFHYHSAFDVDPLGKLIDAVPGDGRAVTETLRRIGFTHVWVHWSELERLHNTYGYHPLVTTARLRRMAADGRWRVIEATREATLYALP